MNKHLIYLGFAAIAGLTGVVSAGTYSGGGEGTVDKPYRIATAADMNEIGANTEDWGSHFVMVNDINLAEYTGTEFNIIGNKHTPFAGVFDGNSHTISNFTYIATDTWYIGLFGYAGGSAVIKNLTLVDPYINPADGSGFVGCLVGGLRFGTITGCGVEGGSVSGGYYTGGLVGYNLGTISNCYAAGSVSGGYECTGGLVGSNRGSILNCYATASISGVKYTGGLVGRNYGTISNCYAEYSVTGANRTGGLVGESSGTISNCYAEGSVTGTNYSTGGLVGYNWGGTISNCYAESSVTGDGHIGGLVGKNYKGAIENCYATSSVSGNYGTGGLTGCNSDGTISNCYAGGSITGSEDTGGLVGKKYTGTVSASFWDIETTGQLNSDGGEGKTTAQMQTKSTFTEAGWDFTTAIWKMCNGPGYPRLWWGNCIPIADAEPNQVVYAWIDGWAEVVLDGSGSFDPDGNELTYLWSWTVDGDTYDVNGVDPVIELPVGEYVISLTVNDGTGDSEPDQVVITVIEALESHVLIFPPVINRHSRQKNILAWIRLPEGIDKEQISDEPILLYPGEIEAVNQYVIEHGRRGHKRTSVLAFFKKAELMDAVVDNGEVEVEAVGSLTSGRYFYGSDTVLIKARRYRSWWRWRFN